jgi:ribosomal protein S18 acetylase RimI-like enzyme
LVGYAHPITYNTNIELKRLYVDTPWKDCGRAALLMDRILVECRKRGADLLWLTVWMQNHRAITFYEKTGFRLCGSETFMLGEHA